MPEYLAPGVFVEEIDSGSKPIEGVGVSTAAFVGFAKSGEFNKPTFITSWMDFCRIFGEDDESILPALSEELGIESAKILQAKRQSKKPLLTFAEESLKKADEGRKRAGVASNGHCANLGEFTKKYKIVPGLEPYMEGSYLAYSVKGFFDNGGNKAYIVRVPRQKDLELFDRAPSAKALAPVPATADLGGIRVRALTAGKAGNDVKVEVTHGEQPDQFRLKFSKGDKSEELPAKKGEFFTPSTVAGAKGSFAEVTEVMTQTRPDAKLYDLLGGADATDTKTLAKLPFENELERLKDKTEDLLGDSSDRRGAMGIAFLEDVNFICMPDLMAGVFERQSIGNELGPEVCVLDEKRRQYIMGLQRQLVDFCEGLNDRMAILDPLPNLEPQEMRDSIKGVFSCDHGQAAMYYPWVRVEDKLHRKEKATLLVPPCGHIAGVWARTAVEKGIHKAPANEALRGIVGMEREVSKFEQEILNPDGINCIRTFPASGIRVWGARTLATTSNPSWRYVNVRQIFNYLGRSIDRGMQWVVFEPNDPDLWGRVRRNISAFLWTCWKEGMLFGTVPEEAFYVKCDAETNPQEMIDLGRLYVEIGVNPVKPAEFVIIRMGQWAGGSEKTEN